MGLLGFLFDVTVGEEIRESHKYNARCGRSVHWSHAGQMRRCTGCPYKNRGKDGLACAYWDGGWH